MGNWTRTARPARSWVAVKARAEAGVMAPRAMGRNLVRVTLGSMLRSQRSLIAQPAPRMMRAPVPKRRVVVRTVGRGVAGSMRVLARRVDHMQGRKR